MKDKFLYSNRPPIRQTFKDQLSHRLSEMVYGDRDTKKENAQMKHPIFKLDRKLAWALPVLVLAMIFAFSQPARAMASQFAKSIAGFFVLEQTVSPLEGQALGESDASTNQAKSEAVPTAQITEYVVPTASLPQVLQNPPFDLSLPSWVPAGFTLNQNVGVANSGDWVLLTWESPDASEIELLIEKEYTGYAIPAGVDSSEEISINGSPALLINGFWDAQHQWDTDRKISLDWEKAGHHYHIDYTQRDKNNVIQPIQSDKEEIKQNLIQMAESIH